MTWRLIQTAQWAERYGEDVALALEDWFIDQQNDFEFMDNYRVFKPGNVQEWIEYEKAQEDGCCGFYDEWIELNGEKFYVGFNYGH